MSQLTAEAVLRSALLAEEGWRAKARLVLGLAKSLACGVCGQPFLSGGRHRKTCGRPRCQRANVRRRVPHPACITCGRPVLIRSVQYDQDDIKAEKCEACNGTGLPTAER